MASRMSVAEKLEIWRLLREGTSFRVIGRRLGRSDATIQQYVGLTGGVRPRERFRAANQLSLGEREDLTRNGRGRVDAGGRWPVGPVALNGVAGAGP